MKLAKPVFLILLITAISFGGVYFLYRNDLSMANKPVKVVKPDNYTDKLLQEISFDDVVEITGTPDLLRQVSQEGERLNDEGETIRSVDYYYVGLKEYGYDFVVKIKPGKLFAKEQTFRGRVTGLSKTEFENRIKNSLNKEINFQDSVNEEAAKEIDAETQGQLSERSKANFTSSTLLVLDNETINEKEIYTKVIFWGILLSVFLTTLFRKTIFDLRKD